MTDAEIIAEYDRREEQFRHLKSAKQIAQETADKLALPYEHVREVLLASWTNQGAG